MKNKRHVLLITLFIIILNSIPHSGSVLPTSKARVFDQSLTISIYTDKYYYSKGDTMHLGLDIVNTGPTINVCGEIWLEKPDTSTLTILHDHDITVPHGLDYSNPSLMSDILPDLPPGAYTWHIAALDPSTHDVLLEAASEWEFITGQVVQIGIIVPEESSLDRYGPIFDFAREDINNFCAKLGYDISFDFLIEHADGQAAIHLEKVQFFNTIDVNLLVAGFWSSQAQSSLDYVNENDMLMFSPSSTSPVLSVPDDNLFRLCPNDDKQAAAIAEMLSSLDIYAIVVIQRADTWADGIFAALEVEYLAKGGVIGERIRYNPEKTEFLAELTIAESKATEMVAQYGSDHVAIQLISFTEAVNMLLEVESFSTLYSLLWFGTDGTALNPQIVSETPVQAEHLKLYSTTQAPTYSLKWYRLAERYEAATGEHLDIYLANAYDIACIYAKSVLLAASTETDAVKSILADVAGDYFGVTGWCLLNDAGDRYSTDYDIWGCGYVDGYVDWVKYGWYDQFTEEVYWLN